MEGRSGGGWRLRGVVGPARRAERQVSMSQTTTSGSSFYTNPKSFFTSESVTEGHPDKLCDQISDGVLDALLGEDPLARVACETATTTGIILVMGEITTTAWADIPQIVRDTIRRAG